jgi:ABC-2 type transport system ATP-binding protein
VAAIKARYGTERTLVVDLEAPGPPLAVAGTETIKVEGVRQWLRFRTDAHTAASVLAEVTRQADVRDLVVEEPDIELIVRGIYSRSTLTAHQPTS